MTETEKIGLSCILKNVTPSGATIVFTQNNNIGKPTGELEYGEDFIIEVQNKGAWEQAPIVLKGDYAFNGIAHLISANETVEKDIKWEWLYGKLKPGNYRIKKTILDFRSTANFDKYVIYTEFKIN